MPDPHSNFAYSTVATAPSPASSGTSLVVAAADGAKFPSTGSFNATVWPAATQPTTANAEIIRVTAISTDTFTITRAQESTSARTIVVGDQIAATVTAKTLTDVEQASSYLTSVDQTVAANTQTVIDDYLELAASFVYELASGAELVVGDFATPVPLPDQNTNIFVSVADETIPKNSEVVFSEFYELSTPFATEVSGEGVLQLGTAPAVVGAFLPGYEVGYDQITTGVNVTGLTQSTGTVIITCNTHYFDGGPVLLEFVCGAVQLSSVASNGLGITLNENGSVICDLAFIRSGVVTSPVPDMAVDSKFRFTPTAGYHSYVITAYTASTTGTPIINAGNGTAGANIPAFVRFSKV